MIGLHAMMYAITMNVVMPPMTSVLTVVAFARSLKSRSRISGVSCRRLTVRAAMRSLLRHTHTDVRRSGRLENGSARRPPGRRGAYSGGSAIFADVAVYGCRSGAFAFGLVSKTSDQLRRRWTCYRGRELGTR